MISKDIHWSLSDKVLNLSSYSPTSLVAIAMSHLHGGKLTIYVDCGQ